jgi:hypothetical protein
MRTSVNTSAGTRVASAARSSEARSNSRTAKPSARKASASTKRTERVVVDHPDLGHAGGLCPRGG